MAKLRHIAFIVKEPKTLYDFYHHLFGVEQVRHGPTGAIHVIDGLFNLAFLTQLSQLGSIIIFFRPLGREKFRDFKGREFQSGCSVDQVSSQAGIFAYNQTPRCIFDRTAESKTAKNIVTGTL
jgi:catechol 2,3-dioxygenase-like lactoylglutathione lyase family enzyme